MKNCNFILIFLFIFLISSFSNERSDIEIKNKVFPEDWIEFGEFEEIRIAPHGLFTNKQNQFVQMTKYSQDKLGLIFSLTSLPVVIITLESLTE